MGVFAPAHRRRSKRAQTPRAPFHSNRANTPTQPSPLEGEGWGGGATSAHIPHVMSFLNRDGLIETDALGDATPPDLTREPMELPASRPLRLQALTRGDEGFILSLAYSTQRGYGRTHAFVGELRIGTVAVEMDIPELGFSIEIGEVELTECETVNQFTGSKTEPPQFTRGYGLVFGQTERKAIAMSLVDRALRWAELGEHRHRRAQIRPADADIDHIGDGRIRAHLLRIVQHGGQGGVHFGLLTRYEFRSSSRIFHLR